jgi:hypothetical protein
MIRVGHMRTYCFGYHLKLNQDVTFGCIRRVCASLNVAFGPGHEFVPEAITEGGIKWVNWPGKTEGMYKTMRFQTEVNAYPAMHDPDGTNVADEYVAYPKVSKVTKLATVLKAFGDAPMWTMKELRVFAASLESEAGLKAMPSTYPREIILSTV